MSRPLPKGHSAKKNHSQITGKKKVGTDVILIALAIILAGVPFCLGKYFELSTPGAFDSGAYTYSAAHILHGARIGIEEIPSAQPGTLLVNILGVWLFGFSDTGPKLIQGLLQLAALVLMFVTVRKLFCTLAATVSVIVASVYLSAPVIAKFGNVKEQYMIAFMVMGISCFVLGQLSGKSFWNILSGAFLIWAPMFKPTGLSAPGALGIFLIVQVVLKNRTIRKTTKDIGLLVAGAVVAMAPMYIWIITADVKMDLPYSFVWKMAGGLLPCEADGTNEDKGTYVSASHELVSFAEQWPRVLRYYRLLILPIALAVVSIAVRFAVWIRSRLKRAGPKDTDKCARFVLLFGLWWALDMAFVWISSFSYEQYYLPLNASAAMLSGYIVTLYWRKLDRGPRPKWIGIGIASMLVMMAMSWHIFAGIGTSPHSGARYGGKRRGYIQKYQEISLQHQRDLKGPWQVVGEYIRTHSEPDDKIYVWGWYPGIYVQAQRFSSASRAFTMPRPVPAKLAEEINTLLAEFNREKPKFIVDSRKRHIPMERPPYELWPLMPKGFMGSQKSTFLPLNKEIINQYDREWARLLAERFDEDEAERYRILKPFREFVMTDYRIVSMFGEHVLFELKNNTGNVER